jgi:uncharacterized SAM-binding protein YcdF (DUF218 family)
MPRRLTVAGLVIASVVVALALLDPPHMAAHAPVRADAALVLSGDVEYRRLERASALVRSGAVAWLILTGAGVGGDDAETMRRLVIKDGVPADRVLVEPRATSTRENLIFSATLFGGRGIRSVALITNASHMGRAERVARKVIPEMHWISVPVPDPGPRLRIYCTRLQEWAKLAWYAVRGWI